MRERVRERERRERERVCVKVTSFFGLYSNEG